MLCFPSLKTITKRNFTENDIEYFKYIFNSIDSNLWAPTPTSNDFFKGALSGLRQFLATENPLKMMKNAFYFTLKALYVLKVFTFLFRPLGHVSKWLD